MNEHLWEDQDKKEEVDEANKSDGDGVKKCIDTYKVIGYGKTF